MKKIFLILAIYLTGASLCFAYSEKTNDGPEDIYTIEQSISDKAQSTTIAFNGIGFLGGCFGASTFLPPGKVCDYFGFQYMRDIEASGEGHNPKYLTRIAANVLSILSDKQKEEFKLLAFEQEDKFRELAINRFPLIKAFHEQVNLKKTVNRQKVVDYLGNLFELDGDMSIQRAEVFAKIIKDLSANQKSQFEALKFNDFNSWSDIDINQYKLPDGTSELVNIVYMTYASEFFSWYKGNKSADIYFCPERHGTYFGGFYMKDMPAMGQTDYDIDPTMTEVNGRKFMEMLSEYQRTNFMKILDQQREYLYDIVEVRGQISTEMRKIITNDSFDVELVRSLAKKYGQLDGQLAYIYAITYVEISETLNDQQRAYIKELYGLEDYVPAAAYLYATPLQSVGDMDYEIFFAAVEPTSSPTASPTVNPTSGPGSTGGSSGGGCTAGVTEYSLTIVLLFVIVPFAMLKIKS